MLSVIKTSSIVFYAVAAGIALLLAAVFFVTLVRKKRRRRGMDVLFIVAGVLVLAAALAVGLFAVVNMYAPFKTAVADADGKLTFLYNDKKLFAVPALGKAVGLFGRLELSGVIVPFAVCLLCLLSVIAVGAKTYRAKKEQGAPKAQVKESVPAEQTSADETAYIEETQQPSAALDAGAEGELLPPTEQPLETDTAKRIVDEIDALVNGGVAKQEDDINTRLQRAISEGYALFDAPDDRADTQFAAEEEEAEQEDAPAVTQDEAYAEEEDDALADALPYDEQDDGLLSDDPTVAEEEYAETEEDMQAYEEPAEEVAEIIPERRPLSDKKVISVSPESVQEEPRPPVFDYSDVYMRTRVRTIIRRPPAQSAQTQAEPDRKTATQAAQQSQSAAAKRKKITPAPVKPETPPKPAHKEVVAEENSLPLTRKYIILNRRSAAAVFNDYLNTKREQEKKELTGSLNTIIMK